MTNTFASNFSADAVSAYIAAKLLILAQKQVVMHGLCEKAQMPKGQGRTMQFTRYERVDLPQETLAEGVTPAETSMVITTVTAVLDQWGAVIPITDVAIDSVKHPVLQQAIKLAGLQSSETVDREISKVMLAGTNVFYPDGKTSRATLVAANKLDSDIAGTIVATMRTNGAMTYDGTHYFGVVDPFSEEDLLNDTNFVEAHKLANVMNLKNNEIGVWKGIRWVRSNFLPSIALVASAATASSAVGGSLTPATTYDFANSIVDRATGFETFGSAVFSQATAGGQTSIDVTLPALPASATVGSTFKIYAGSNGGTLFLSSSGNAAAAVVNVKTIPTSGDVAPAAPPAALRIRMLFVLGQGGIACSQMNKMRAFITPNQPSDSDPLVQRRKVGWKLDLKAVITNELFLTRLEHAVTNGN